MSIVILHTTQFKRKTISKMKLSLATILSLAAGASAFTTPSLPTAVRSTTQVSETKVCFSAAKLRGAELSCKRSLSVFALNCYIVSDTNDLPHSLG